MNRFRSRVLFLLASFIGGGMVCPLVSAGITNTQLHRSATYVQEGPTTIVPFRHSFRAGALSSFTNQYTSVTLTFGGARSPVELEVDPFDPLSTYVYAHPDDVADQMVTQADLYAQYPLGTYTFTGNGATSSAFPNPNPNVFEDTNSDQLFPVVPLAVTPASFTALQAIDPQADLTVDLIAELNVVGRFTDASATIIDIDLLQLIQNVESDLPNSQLLIPAGTLFPNKRYVLSFRFYNNDAVTGDTISSNSISTFTQMQIFTVPEPGSLALAICGVLGPLGFALAQRRARQAKGWAARSQRSYGAVDIR